MEFNRNHYLVLGVIVFLLGLQLRLVESFTLNDSARRGRAHPQAGAPGPGSGSARPHGSYHRAHPRR